MDYIERAKNGEDINKLVAEFTKQLEDSVKVNQHDEFRKRFAAEMKRLVAMTQEYLGTNLKITDEEANEMADQLMATLDTMKGLGEVLNSLTASKKSTSVKTGKASNTDPLAKFFNEYGL